MLALFDADETNQYERHENHHKQRLLHLTTRIWKPSIQYLDLLTAGLYDNIKLEERGQKTITELRKLTQLVEIHLTITAEERSRDILY